MLRAELIDENGELRGADVNLAERIENHDGQFVFGKLPSEKEEEIDGADREIVVY